MQRLDIYGTPHMGGSLVAYSDAKAEVEKLRGVIRDAVKILEAVDEINPSNYSHDQVCDLNVACNEAYSILFPEYEASTTKPNPATSRPGRVRASSPS